QGAPAPVAPPPRQRGVANACPRPRPVRVSLPHTHASRTRGAVETRNSRRILIVAHKSVATPSLVAEVRRRTGAGPCELALWVPNASDPAIATWTLRRARRMLSKAVGAP